MSPLFFCVALFLPPLYLVFLNISQLLLRLCAVHKVVTKVRPEVLLGLSGAGRIWSPKTIEVTERIGKGK